MGHLLRSLAVVAALVAGALPLGAFEGPAQSAAGSKTAPAKGTEAKNGAAPAKAEDKAATTTQRMLDSGVAAYEAGKTDQAIRAFDKAISGGGLANQQMARALYYRGLSYRKKGEPALAIPDLTSAVWLKDGLSPSDRQEAIANRAAAYHDAGVADAPPVSQPAGVAGASFGADGWQTDMSGSAATPGSSASVSAAPPPTSGPASAPQTATYIPRPPPPPQTSSGSSGGVGGFFSSITNMFGGGSSSSSNGEVTTPSTAQSPPATATSAWTQTTEIATPGPAAQPAPPLVPQPAAAPKPFATQTQVVAVSPPLPVARPQNAAAPAGKYHVQVAAVRTRSEAYALSVRILSQYGGELGARRPEVEQTVIGSMGTFYRVRVGPYASSEESERLCGTLRPSGFDCLVITQ
ncbi:MAG TPA: SPOR domain-containing protein [Hyphomicrobium sp.]